jgi:hypothetical protein
MEWYETNIDMHTTNDENLQRRECKCCSFIGASLLDSFDNLQNEVVTVIDESHFFPTTLFIVFDVF